MCLLEKKKNLSIQDIEYANFELNVGIYTAKAVGLHSHTVFTTHSIV